MALLIIDAMNIIRRVHEAVPGPDSQEKIGNTITSSLASFTRALKTHRPTHGVAVFDHGGRTWKHELFEHYQANRTPISPLLQDGLLTIKQKLQHLGLHWIPIKGSQVDQGPHQLPGAILGSMCLECLSLADTTVIQWQSTAGNGGHGHMVLLP